MGLLVIGTFGIMALISFALIVVIPKQVGSAQSLYNKYELCPAIIAKVDARDMTLLS